MSQGGPDEHLRDLLARHGSMSPVELSRLSGVSLPEVLRRLRHGALQPAPARQRRARCLVCGGPAEVNDLCAECRRGFIAADRRAAAEAPPPDPTARARFHSRHSRRR